MTIEQAKEKLKKDGYTWFELTDFDPEFYNWLSILKCNKNTNYKDIFTQLKADVNYSNAVSYVKINHDFYSFEKAEEKKYELLNAIKKPVANLLGPEPTLRAEQIWYHTDFNSLFSPLNLERDDYEMYVKKIVTHFFDIDESQKYSFLNFATYYDNECKLENHSDGTGTGRICAMLIYLNETYDEKDGGILILNNEESVIPTFGKVAIIDLQTFDIPHMVSEVTGGIGRYALLSFIKKKEYEFIHSKYDTETII
jgi:hypothetical protein